MEDRIARDATFSYYKPRQRDTRGGEALFLEPISPKKGFNKRVNVMPQCGEGGSAVRVLFFSLGFKITLFVPVSRESPVLVAGLSFCDEQALGSPASRLCSGRHDGATRERFPFPDS
jgi:hypothetical protein